MKNLIFGLIATVFMVNLSWGNSNLNGFTETTSNFNYSTSENPWALIMAVISLEYRRGTNTVINGVRHECINGGLCVLMVNKSSNVISDSNKLDKSTSYIGFDKDGNIFIIDGRVERPIEMYEEFIVESDVSFSKETLEVINNQLKKINSRAEEFKGIFKGKKLMPFQYEGYSFLKIN